MGEYTFPQGLLFSFLLREFAILKKKVSSCQQHTANGYLELVKSRAQSRFIIAALNIFIGESQTQSSNLLGALIGSRRIPHFVSVDQGRHIFPQNIVFWGSCQNANPAAMGCECRAFLDLQLNVLIVATDSCNFTWLAGNPSSRHEQASFGRPI
jgi:hypothetical protein